MPVNKVLTTEQKILLFINPKTPAQNPADLDGLAAWSMLEGEGIITIEPAEDGKSCWAHAQAIGSALVEVKADADLDEGEVRELSDSYAITVVGAEAELLGAGAGEPELK